MINYYLLYRKLQTTSIRLFINHATVQLAVYSYYVSAELLILDGTLIYSDENGNMTATTVLNILQNWLQSNNASITIDRNVPELSNLYPTKRRD